jgi:hypothetical protein
MIGPVLQFADLQQICKPGENPKLSTVEAWARKIGVRFQYDGAGGIWTTVDALNAALGIGEAANETKYDPTNLV